MDEQEGRFFKRITRRKFDDGQIHATDADIYDCHDDCNQRIATETTEGKGFLKKLENGASSTSDQIVTQDLDVIDMILNKKPVDSWMNTTEVTSQISHQKAQPKRRPTPQLKEWILQ